MRAAVIAAVILAASSLAHAGGGGGIVIPPAEIDVGAGAAVTGDALVGPSTEILAGVHWASLCWKPTPFDIGFGFVGSFRPVLPGLTLARTTGEVNDNVLRLGGGYLDLAYAIEDHEHWRTWVAARIETLRGSVNGQSIAAIGGAVRIASELFVAGKAATGSGGGFAVLSGALAIGVYVEGVRRDLPHELGPISVDAGLSVRVPFMAVLVH